MRSNLNIREGMKCLMFFLSLCLIFVVLVFILNSAKPSGHMDAQSKAMAAAVAVSVERFRTDYNSIPDLSGLSMPSGGQTDSGDGVKLLQVLLAQEDPAVENKRKINYLKDIKETKKNLKNNGIYYGGNGDSDVALGLYDTYGNPFMVVLNLSNEDSLKFTYGGKPYELEGKLAAVMSPGRDGKAGTKDDIFSFNPKG